MAALNGSGPPQLRQVAGLHGSGRPQPLQVASLRESGPPQLQQVAGLHGSGRPQLLQVAALRESCPPNLLQVAALHGSDWAPPQFLCGMVPLGFEEWGPARLTFLPAADQLHWILQGDCILHLGVAVCRHQAHSRV